MAQQCFWSPFMFCRFRYSLVSCRVLIASVIRESVNFFCKQTPALRNTFHHNFCMQMDSGNVFCYSIRGLLQIPTVVVKSWQQVTLHLNYYL